jgi:O-antigen ligase
MFLDSPILGLGPGSYVIEYEHYAILPWWTDPLGHAHNMYLQMLAETGMIGLFFYVAMVVSWVTFSVVVVRSDATDRWLFLKAGVLATVVAVSVHSVFDNLYVQGLNIQLAVWLGVAATLYSAKNRERRNSALTTSQLQVGLEH